MDYFLSQGRSPVKKDWKAILAGAAASLFLFVSSVHAFDFSDWDAMLKKYISSATIDGIGLHTLAYKTMKNDPAFSKLIKRLETASLNDLKTREEKLSFWINVYNILAAKMILDNYPVDSIKDIGSLFKSVWKRNAGVVGGKERTLNEVEHEILRKMDEPRIHAAIVCASVSCPDLKKDIFVPGRLDEQLDDQMRMFLKNPGKGMRTDGAKRRVYLSSIFKWFKADFESRGGVISFIGKYVSPDDRKLLADPKLKVSYLDYNWAKNEL